MRRRRRNNAKKERIIMIASTVLVLGGLTLTGVYLRNNHAKDQDDGYSIDFSALEKDQEPVEDLVPEFLPDNKGIKNNLVEMDEELDLSQPLEEADSGDVKIPGLTLQEHEKPKDSKKPTDQEQPPKSDVPAEEQTSDKSLKQQTLADEAAMAADAAKEQGNVAGQTDSQETVKPQISSSFQPGDRLVWPVSGTVLIEYSMDKTVYFTTLQQYKYNPGLVVSATKGDQITAAAAGTVTEVFFDEEIGNAVRVDIGGGYVATYGQLEEVQVSKGSVVQVGTLLGYVASPTKYYVLEGTNAYFSLTKDGKPVDPLGQL